MASSSYAACPNSSYEEESKSETQPKLYAVNSYVFGFDDYMRMTQRLPGVACQISSAKLTETIECENGTRAVGVSREVPCSIYDRISSSSRSIACRLLGFYITTDWRFYDKAGESFDSFSEGWETKNGIGRWTGNGFDNCNGGMTERSLRVLGLRAGSAHLYFIKVVDTTYKPIRQPSL